MRTTVVCTDNNQMIGIIGRYSQYPIFIYIYSFIYLLFFFYKSKHYYLAICLDRRFGGDTRLSVCFVAFHTFEQQGKRSYLGKTEILC